MWSASSLKKVLICIDSFYDGGAEIFPIRLANELSEKCLVYFLELNPSRSKEKKQHALLQTRKVTILSLSEKYQSVALLERICRGRSVDAIKAKLVQVSKLLEVRKFILQERISIVHSHHLESDIFFSRLKRLVSFALISSFHGHYELSRTKQKNFKERVRKSIHKIDRVIYLSEAHQQTLDEFSYDTSKRRKIYYGYASTASQVDVTSYVAGSRLKLLLVGRGIREKGWEETINAFLNLSKKFHDALSLTLVGQGAFLNETQLTYSHPLLEFVGYKDDVTPYIEQAHVCLLPSYFIGESLPNAVIEYLAFGKPVIATSIGAIEEMITHDGNIAGHLLQLKNKKVDVGDIEIAISQYLENPSLVAKHSALAFKAFTKFEMRSCVANHLSLYDELTNSEGISHL